MGTLALARPILHAIDRAASRVDLLLALSQADLRSRYGRGPWRVVKWLLDPFALVGVYLLLVTFVLHRAGAAPGLSLACAVIPFQLVMTTVTNAMSTIAYRRAIILNMSFNRTLLPVSAVLTELIAFAGSLLLFVLMMAAYGVAPSLAALWLPVVIAVSVAFSIGVAYPAALFGAWFPDLRPFAVSFVRILFFVAPGLVPLAAIPGRAQDLVRLNPLTGLPGRAPVRPQAGGVGARLPARRRSCPPRLVRAGLPPRATAVRQDRRVSASIRVERAGVRFVFDRQSRRVSPTMAQLRRRSLEVWGIREITCSIGPGESVALIGASGAGKTTLLRTLGGVYAPDEGMVDVRGRIGTLLSVEAGLLSPLTGRENAVLIGVLNGLSRRRARAALPEVHAGSGLGESFDRPVGSYSEGMRARLGYAVAEQAEPNVLLLDEVHEALDHEFRDTVEASARRLLAAGGIVVAAGHDHLLLERLCTRALLLQEGRLVADGEFEEIRSRYLAEEGL